MKRCAKCKRLLDEAAFNSFRGDKLQSYCIQCMKQYKHEYHARLREKRKKERAEVRRRLLLS